MVRTWPDEKKRKSRENAKSWMNAPIVFPPIHPDNFLDEPLIVEAVIEGYLVRRVFVDGGASVEIMFEQCFDNRSPIVKSRLRPTQTDLLSFTGNVANPLGKIELEVEFGNKGLSRTISVCRRLEKE